MDFSLKWGSDISVFYGRLDPRGLGRGELEKGWGKGFKTSYSIVEKSSQISGTVLEQQNALRRTGPTDATEEKTFFTACDKYSI